MAECNRYNSGYTKEWSAGKDPIIHKLKESNHGLTLCGKATGQMSQKLNISSYYETIPCDECEVTLTEVYPEEQFIYNKSGLPYYVEWSGMSPPKVVDFDGNPVPPNPEYRPPRENT